MSKKICIFVNCHEKNCGEKKIFFMFVKNYISQSYGPASMSILNLKS